MMRTVICKFGSGCQALAEKIHGEEYCEENCGNRQDINYLDFDADQREWECIRIERMWREGMKKADPEVCQNFNTEPL